MTIGVNRCSTVGVLMDDPLMMDGSAGITDGEEAGRRRTGLGAGSRGLLGFGGTIF